jgi:NADH-quinone oxidoreductase subunit I
MGLITTVRETYGGFKSLLVGMRITLLEAVKPIVTVQYPRETLKMPDRFRGHLKLVLDPTTGRSICNACGLCVRACPSDCIELDGCKREGEKRKSVSKYELDFTKCSLCGSCVEACPSDAIEYSKEYNTVSFNRDDFARMDIMERLNAEARVWAKTHPQPEPTAPAPAAASAPVSPIAPAPSAVASAVPAATPAVSASASTPAPSAVASAVSVTTPVPAPKPSVEAPKLS